jgi:hypothetical protein
MPTKHPSDLPALSADTIAVLLDGWGAAPPAGVARTHGFGGGYLQLACTGELGPAGLWAAYEAELRERAREWGWMPHFRGPDGELRFFGQAAVWETDHGEPHVHGALALHDDERDDDQDDEPEDDQP